MQNAAEKEIRREVLKCNNAAESGLCLVTLQELNSLLCLNKALESASIAQKALGQDLRPLTPEDSTTLFPAQKADSTPLEISSSVAALAMLKSQTNEANARLIAAAPTGLDVAQKTYITLLHLSPDNEFRAKNQAIYAALRDYIALATGREAEDVQNDYAWITDNASLTRAKGGE